MEKIIYKAAKYIRLSCADDNSKTNESESVQNQRKMLDAYIGNQPDIEVVSEWVDDGVSGIIFDRPKFKEMMSEVEAGNINCVIVKDLSRLGREYIETGRYLQRIFPAYGVRFIAINDNIDTLSDTNNELIVGIKSIMNDAYCRDISIKTRSALKSRRESGNFVAAYPVYGYQKDADNRNQLVVDEYPASIVRDIFRMKLEGVSALKIAQTLNTLGVLSPIAYKQSRGLPHAKNGYCNSKGAQWSPTTIIRILNDETYTGTLIQGKQSTPNYKIKDIVHKPQSEWMRTENAHEAIISLADFDLAQKIMRLDTRTTPGGDKVYLFSGILICGCCGARMTRKSVPHKHGKYHYYYCPTTKKRGCNNAPMLKEGNLVSCVLDSLKTHVSNVASLETILESNNNQRMTEALVAQYMTKISDNEAQLKQTRGIKSTLYENMVGGALSKSDYKELKSKYTSDETRLNSALEALRQELEDIREGKGERLRWTETFKQFESLAELDRRTVINLISSICIKSKTELDITFNYQAEYDIACTLLERAVA